MSSSGAVVLAATIQLFWSDNERLLRHSLLPWGERIAIEQVNRIFEEIGVTVVWSELDGAPVGSHGKVAVVVVLTSKDPVEWGLARGTLGAVMGREGPVACVYAF